MISVAVVVGFGFLVVFSLVAVFFEFGIAEKLKQTHNDRWEDRVSVIRGGRDE